MKKKYKQILIISLVILLFAAYNLSIYALVTYRCGANFKSRIIEPERYLPFDDNAEFSRIETDFQLSGEPPRIDGAAALLPVYAALVDAVYPENSVEFDGESYTENSAIRFTDTVKAYKAVVDGSADIILCAAPSKQQREYALQQGAELEYVPIGLEAFVFFVNADNPVDELTVDEIRAIYSGEITNWKDVGGINRPINPIDRPEGSGSQTVMLSFMNGEEIRKNPLGIIGGAIGFSFRFYVDGIVANDGVKLLSVNGVYPDKDNIKNRTYPIIYPFYAVYRKDNDNENIAKLIDFILSEDGQDIIESNGYTPIK